MDGTNLQYIATDGLSRPHSIGVDWVAGQVYWTDSGADLIEVSRGEGRYLEERGFL